MQGAGSAEMQSAASGENSSDRASFGEQVSGEVGAEGQIKGGEGGAACSSRLCLSPLWPVCPKR